MPSSRELKAATTPSDPAGCCAVTTGLRAVVLGAVAVVVGFFVPVVFFLFVFSFFFFFGCVFELVVRERGGVVVEELAFWATATWEIDSASRSRNAYLVSIE